MKKLTLLLTIAIAACVALVTLESPARALDRVTLKNGKVYEGEITKEGEGFVFIDIKIGGLKRQEIVTTDQVVKIERDVDMEPAAAPGKQASSSIPASTAPEKAPAAEPAPADEKEQTADVPSSGTATRVAFISLEDQVGTHLNADALKRSFDIAMEENPDIIVLVIDSGGGALLEVQPLSDTIHEDMKPKARIVGWIRSAISAASLTIFNCEEIYMMREGNVGGTVAFRPGAGGGGNQALSGADLEQILRAGEMISKRGKRNPLIMRAMQVFGVISADIDENGTVTWYEGDEGEYLVNPDDRILTFNSEDAKKFGVSKGTADTKEELLRAMGVKEWIEVAPDADEYQREFRANVSKFQALAQTLMSEFSLALNAANQTGGDEKLRNMYIGRARGKLQELQSAVRKAPSFEKYSQFNKEWFEEQFDQLRRLAASRTN